MAEPSDYYGVLGVPPTADRAAIHAAWKALLRRYHPDANRGVDVSARAKEINEAYAVLGKAGPRASYDRSRLPPRTAAHRPVYAAPAGRRPMRPGPSMRPTRTYSEPLATSQWLMGLFLLLLTAAPLGMILILHNEEAARAEAMQRASAVRRGPEVPATPGRIGPGAKLREQPPVS